MSDPIPVAAATPPWRLVLTLAMAGLLSGFGIVGVYQATLPTIEANKAAALARAVFEVVPGAATMGRYEWADDALVAAPDGKGEAVYAAWGPDGALLGFAIPAEGPGFQDTIRLLYGYAPAEGRITGLRVLESRETPGLGDKIIKDAHFVGTWTDLRPAPGIVLVPHGARANPNEVDAITGATISSRAVVKIVDTAHASWGPRVPQTLPAPTGEVR